MDSANRGASGKSKKSEAGKGRRQPPVLDLTATEVASGSPSAESAAAPPEQPAPEAAAPQAGSPAADPSATPPAAMPPEYPGAPAPEAVSKPQAGAPAPPTDAAPTAVPPAGAKSTAEAEVPLAARDADPLQGDGGRAPPAPALERPRRWPAVLGGVVGGGLAGAAATAGILYGVGILPARPDRAAPDAMRPSALESQMRSITSAPPGASPARLDELAAGAAAGAQALDTLKALEARLAKVESSLSQPAAPAAAAPSQPAAADPAVQALTESIAELRRRIDENAVAAQAARDAAQRSSGASDATAASLGGEVESLGRRVVALEAAVQSAQGTLQALRTDTQGTLQNLRAELAAAVQASRTPDPDRAARLAAATMALRLAVEQGEPFVSELAAVKPFVEDPKRLAPLESFAATGVPQAGTLARELVGLLEDQRRRTAAASSGETTGVLGRLQQSASKLVSIRPADAPPAAPGTPMAALTAAAARGDLAGALAEAEKLPDAVRAPLAPWIDKAKGQAAALTAARQLARDSLAALAANAASRQ